MGTRSLTVVHDAQNNEEICVIYRQFDGYPSAHGVELAMFLANTPVVNGIGSRAEKVANGPHCLAAQLVTFLKIRSAYAIGSWHEQEPGDVAGGIYLHSPGTRDLWEDYRYHVYVNAPGQPVGMAIEFMEYVSSESSEMKARELYRGSARSFTLEKVKS
jgi:hypothetical protein